MYAHRVLLSVRGITNEVVFEEEMEYNQPIILMGTHCRAMDHDTSFAYFGEPVAFIGKEEVFKIPVFGTCSIECGNIPINRTNRNDAVSTCRGAALQCKIQKKTVGIYPEGTRRRKRSIGDLSQLLPFKKGGFYMARDAEAIIVPAVHIGCSRLSETWLAEWGKTFLD